MKNKLKKIKEESKIVWNYVKKEEFPEESKQIWCCLSNKKTYQCFIYKKDSEESNDYLRENVLAWCELPKYEEQC